MNADVHDKINITCFTDPLCCWSWAMEPQIRKFRFQFRHHINWQYRLGGLIPSWENYVDNINSVSRPAQMGPLWLHAEQVSGMPMAHMMWAKDPPSSSFPACIAVRCVMVQTADVGERYLRMIREACMINGLNISNPDLLMRLAMTLNTIDPAFNYELFEHDFNNVSGQKLFRQDWHAVKVYDIQRFPTLLMTHNDQTIRLSGYKPFSSLVMALTYLVPGIQPKSITESISEYRSYWNGLTEREEKEFYSECQAQPAAL
jgi:putative protein-disulfide isomerase